MGELANERGRQLFGYAYLLTGSAADADDLVQAAFVREFSARRSWPHGATPEANVLRAIRTLCIDLKHLARRSHGDRDTKADQPLPPPTPGVHKRPALENALALLSPPSAHA